MLANKTSLIAALTFTYIIAFAQIDSKAKKISSDEKID